MPPISTGSDCALGATIRFAPRLRSSRFTRSPISSITPSMAVATAVPIATAATVMALRRGDRRIDWLTKRRNMRLRGIAEEFLAGNELVAGDHQLIACYLRSDWDGIASAGRADAGNEDGGSAILADHVGTFLIVTLIATNVAGIEGRYQRLVGAPDDDEAHMDAGFVDGEAVQVAVVHHSHRNADLAVDERNRCGGRQLGSGFGIDEFGGDTEDEKARGEAGCGHPKALALHAPTGFAEGGALQAVEHGGAAFAIFHQQHGAGEGQDGHEEEDLVADDWTDQSHFLAAAGKHLAFGELMQPGDNELHYDDHQDDRSHAKEAAQIDADGAAHEADAEQYGEAQTEHNPCDIQDSGGIELDGGKHENGLHALAEDHQEDEQEDAPAAAGTAPLLQLSFNFAFHAARMAVHPDHHREDEDGANEQGPALIGVLAEAQAGEQPGEGKASNNSASEGPVHGRKEVAAADLAEVRDSDGDHQGGFDTFAESDDQCLQHSCKWPR